MYLKPEKSYPFLAEPPWWAIIHCEAPGVISSFSSYNSLRERAWELELKGGRESLIAGSYAIFWLHCPRWRTGVVVGVMMNRNCTSVEKAYFCRKSVFLSQGEEIVRVRIKTTS